MPERLFVSVTFDPARGYVAVHPELPPVVAPSLDGTAQDQALRRHCGSAARPRADRAACGLAEADQKAVVQA
jgi:hypothetical protein